VPRILVVDDDKLHGDYLATLLTRSGEEVEQASSARQALSRLALGGVDVVITDLLMPEVDGIELVREIHHRYPGMRVIGVTGCQPSLRLLAKALMSHFGLRALLPKPIDTTALHLALKEPAPAGSEGVI
jgi:two-component system response regulator YesN